ncbi:hypothetical protein KC340_g6684 [Hortaea werneckii]|nr:hypothetical protein KC342_g7013 [Hortaea werneckii]KAI7098100.1 hypothetical protein KC339_g9211 [Hortaea werneckii]KAI7239750.1 hypothetical protein KC365_g3997 [Hortaea werneckii]KAI7323424.1 hypothetical protein KC340_g6684 [Hortaea werneckii]KAI7371725.1 hypothetical protein KC328_g17472 [Hortaea werneckii]
MSDLPTNYLGAAIFWSYILAALAFTGLAIHTILKINPPIPRPKTHDDANLSARPFRLFAFLASLSFATLSANMLHVLIHSFQHWHSTLPPTYPASSEPTPWLSLIWHWSTTSTLFQDFARAILATPARRIWTFSELGMAMAICLHLGLEGRRRQTPRLYVFFALSQILPVSFAQGLFYLAVLRKGDGGLVVGVTRVGRRVEGDGRDGGGEKGFIVIPPAWVAVTCLAYGGCIAAACLLNETGFLMPFVLLARVLLLAPQFLPLRLYADDSVMVRAVQTALPLFGLVMVGYTSVTAILDDDDYGLSIFRALFSHPAVSSLGCDAMLSVISLALWNKINAQAEETERLRQKSR